MPTSRELNTLLRPLLKRRSDLAYHKRMVFFQPLTHYLRGVVFFQGWSSGDFKAETFVTPLFDGDHAVHVGQVGPNSGRAYRRFSEEWKEDPDAASAELCEYLEQQVLPIIEPMTAPFEIEKLPQYMGSTYAEAPLVRSTMAVGACFVGDLDKAQHLLVGIPEQRRPPAGPVTEKFKEEEDPFLRIAYLSELLRTDRSRVIPLLHEWEAAKVRHLDLGKFWKPTPFPCESTIAKS